MARHIKEEIPIAVLIGFRLKVLRNHNAKTLSQVARKVGLSTKGLRKIENAESNWRFTTIVKICMYYGISLKELFSEENIS
jgi:DNA-binding XRE family transcriptional regulator